MAKFIRFPWAITGDRAAIPEPTEGSGAVSWAQGFGPDYEITPGDPGWRPVPRPETNQYLYDLSDNLRQYQLFGVPEWYDASNNGGVAISYAVNAIVRHNDLVYRSIVASNTVEPGTDAAKWVVDGVAGQATTAVSGLTRYATTVEAAARTINNAAVTPLGLGALFDLLLNQPIFPEVNTTDGLFTLSSPGAGTFRIAAGTTWTHRGAFLYTSALTDLATSANKVYHARWDRVNGFALYDLASGTYNPSSVAETDPVFDTTYDSMLVARVVTNGSNVATITSLANKNQFAVTLDFDYDVNSVGTTWTTLAGSSVGLSWARTPTIKTCSFSGLQTNQNSWGTAGGGNFGSARVRQTNVTRYSSGGVEYVYQDTNGDAGKIALVCAFSA